MYIGCSLKGKSVDNQKVSIITVCLNSAATIERTICSVLGQSYPNIEYIIIDGKSTDGTQQIIRRYMADISYYCSERDTGIYNAMNKGIQQARGDIIGIINGDDWYAPNAVELAVRGMQESKSQMVYGDLAIVYEDGNVKTEPHRKIEDIYERMVIGHPTVFASKGIYQRYGGFDEAYKSASDYELMLRWRSKGVKMHYIPEIFAYFRRGGYSDSDLKINVEETYHISRKYIEKYNGEDKEYYIGLIEKNKSENEKKVQIKERLKNLSLAEKEQIKKELKREKDIVIFGTGDYGCWCYDIFMALGITVSFWADNNPGKQGKELLGLSVIPAEKLEPDAQQVIVGTKDYEEELVKQLESMGITRTGYLLISDIEHLFLTCEDEQTSLISIIVPVYNVKEYIRECLLSIASQSYPQIEAIIVDDGSKDGSGALCDEIAHNYPNMYVIHQDNQGVAMARKRGAGQAKGEYICFVDADDFIEPDYCRNLVQQIKGFDLLVASSYSAYDIQGKIPCGAYETDEELAYIYANMMMYGNTNEYGLAPYICDKLFRTNIAQKVFEETDKTVFLSEDADFLYRYALKCKSLRISESVCGYRYRKRADSATYSIHETYLKNYNDLYLSLKTVFEKHPQKEELILQLQKWMSKMICKATRVMGFDVSVQVLEYIFPFQNALKGKKAVLYGAGNVGQMYYRQICFYEECNLALWVDKNYVKYEKQGVRPVEEVKRTAFDVLVVAVESEKTAMEIKDGLMRDLGVEGEKIVWEKPRSTVI